MNSAIVPTKVLTEPTELERILQSGLHTATSGQFHSAQAAANGYSFNTHAAFGAESFQVINKYGKGVK